MTAEATQEITQPAGTATEVLHDTPHATNLLHEVKPKDESADAVVSGRLERGWDWSTLTWVTLLHVGAVAGLFFFTWKALALVVVSGWVTGGLGICLGYHRLITHSSFQTYRPIRGFLACLGVLAGEGSPIFWVAHHRKHHQFSDQEGDPHSPKHGALWSHVLWLFPKRHSAQYQQMLQRYAPDLLKEPFMQFLDRTFLLWHFATGVGLFFLGYGIWDLHTGISFLMFGVFVRLVYVLHVTWLINSAAHMWGYRNYQTTDDSRNLWWVGILAYGEGWHNNHHAFQRVAHHGHRWWEFDATFVVIRLMERTGLAWKVVRHKPDRPAG